MNDKELRMMKMCAIIAHIFRFSDYHTNSPKIHISGMNIINRRLDMVSINLMYPIKLGIKKNTSFVVDVFSGVTFAVIALSLIIIPSSGVYAPIQLVVNFHIDLFYSCIDFDRLYSNKYRTLRQR